MTINNFVTEKNNLKVILAHKSVAKSDNTFYTNQNAEIYGEHRLIPNLERDSINGIIVF